MAQDDAVRSGAFTAKMIAPKTVRIGLRHAVVCPNVAGRTKEKLAQSKRARTGQKWSERVSSGRFFAITVVHLFRVKFFLCCTQLANKTNYCLRPLFFFFFIFFFPFFFSLEMSIFQGYRR